MSKNKKRRLYESAEDLRDLADRAAPPLQITVRKGQIIFHEETGDRIVLVKPAPVKPDLSDPHE